MLIKEEFTNDMEWVRPAIEAVITSAKGTLSGQHFHPWAPAIFKCALSIHGE